MENKTAEKEGAGQSNSRAEEVILGEREATTKSPTILTKDKSSDSTQEVDAIRETQLEDLPDECLVNILCRVHITSNLPRSMSENVRVGHPLHCALVCKRWHALADAAVSTVNLSSLVSTRASGERVAKRFSNLVSLVVPDVDDDTLLALANGTSRLQDLDMQGSVLLTHPSIGEALARLTGLARLNLRQLNLESPTQAGIAQALARWTGLTRLNLGQYLCAREYKDTEIALNAVSALPSLQFLAFSHMLRGSLLPVCMAVGKMTGLQALHLASDQIPPACDVHFVTVLRELTIQGYEGPQLPDSLGELRRLTRLRVLAIDCLTTLPESIIHLTCLRTLEVTGGSRLTSLPSALGQLKALETLVISFCHGLVSLPESIGFLSHLKILVVMCCHRIKKLPGTVKELTTLRRLVVDEGVELPESLGQQRNLSVERISRP